MSLTARKLHALQLLLLLLCFSQCSSQSNNHSYYCKLPHCGANNLPCTTHKNLNISCAPSTKRVNMKAHESSVLHLLNSYRNKVALGYTRTLFPAARMARMAWSTELEKFAIMYLSRCIELRQLPCMSSPQFTNIGSIYGEVSFTGIYKRSMVPELTEELMKRVFDDTRSVTRSMLMRLNPKVSTSPVRQAVLLMTDRNSHVGCSALNTVLTFDNLFQLVCTFATDNMRDLPIYKLSKTAGSHCHKRDTTYKNLCALGEKYNNSHKYIEGELLPGPNDFLVNY